MDTAQRVSLKRGAAQYGIVARPRPPKRERPIKRESVAWHRRRNAPLTPDRSDKCRTPAASRLSLSQSSFVAIVLTKVIARCREPSGRHLFGDHRDDKTITIASHED